MHTELVLCVYCQSKFWPCLRAWKSYSGHTEVAENTTAFTTGDTPVDDLRGAGVAVHLSELELGLRAGALREGGVADDVSECLSVFSSISHPCMPILEVRGEEVLLGDCSDGWLNCTFLARVRQRPCAWCGRGSP